MDDDYDCIVKSSLKFKNDKKKRKKLKTSHRRAPKESTSDHEENKERKEDAENHGDWWKVDNYDQIRDDIAIEFIQGCYAKSMSNGAIVLGNPHPPGEGPDDEEIFTPVKVGTNQIALKTGFGRYVSVESKSCLMGLSEAVGEPETFTPVFEDGKLAICAFNECFISPDTGSATQPIVAKADKVGPYEVANIRVENDPLMSGKTKVASKGDKVSADTYELEVGHLKKYQTQSNSSRYLSLDDEKRELKKARAEGEFYEALLDRRTKLKSDKYCK